MYRIVPNSRALPNKGAPYGLRKAKTDENEHTRTFPDLVPPPGSDLARAPCVTIRDNTVTQ